MSEEPEPTPWSDIVARRALLDPLRPLRPPQEYHSIEAYHEAKQLERRPVLQPVAALDYERLKRRNR